MRTRSPKEHEPQRLARNVKFVRIAFAAAMVLVVGMIAWEVYLRTQPKETDTIVVQRVEERCSGQRLSTCRKYVITTDGQVMAIPDGTLMTPCARYKIETTRTTNGKRINKASYQGRACGDPSPSTIPLVTTTR